MNLIEQLGGYEEAKMLRGTTSNALLDMKTWTVHVDDIDSALLEHRRANNIFEVGDDAVFREDSRIGGASDAIDLMSVQGIDAFGVRMTNGLCPWVIQIRHATPEEIQAGRRL